MTKPVSYTDTDVEMVARALADACPTPDQCADTHDECIRRHGVHWTALGVGGVGPMSITEIEGSPGALAAVAVSALSAAGRLTPADLLRDLTDDDPCWYDHHGFCQAHGWMATDPRCPHARAKELLAEGSTE